MATMEDADAARKQYEEAVFGNLTNNEVAGTRVSKNTYAVGWNNNPSAKVSRLQSPNGSAKVGPNVFLKVMAGDKISAKVDYYYLTDPGTITGSAGLNGMLQSLMQALVGGKASSAAKEESNQINSSLGGTSPLQSLYNSQPSSGNTNAPKAYLNYIFFDEQFKYVGATSNCTTRRNCTGHLIDQLKWQSCRLLLLKQKPSLLF